MTSLCTSKFCLICCTLNGSQSATNEFKSTLQVSFLLESLTRTSRGCSISNNNNNKNFIYIGLFKTQRKKLNALQFKNHTTKMSAHVKMYRHINRNIISHTDRHSFQHTHIHVRMVAKHQSWEKYGCSVLMRILQ